MTRSQRMLMMDTQPVKVGEVLVAGHAFRTFVEMRLKKKMVDWISIDDVTRRCRAESIETTRAIGESIARALVPGDVITLTGNLGAGKTQFVKSVASALGVPLDEVNSPTFTLIQEYEGQHLIRHCDTYRLRNAEEFADLGLDELFAADGIAFVEWADRVVPYLPLDRLDIRIEILSPTEREFVVMATGKRSRQILNTLNTDQ